MRLPMTSTWESHATSPVDGVLPANVPRSGCPQFCKSRAQSWTLARSAATRMTGMFEVYMKLSGHRMPWPRILPKLRGISIFMD